MNEKRCLLGLRRSPERAPRHSMSEAKTSKTQLKYLHCQMQCVRNREGDLCRASCLPSLCWFFLSIIFSFSFRSSLTQMRARYLFPPRRLRFLSFHASISPRPLLALRRLNGGGDREAIKASRHWHRNLMPYLCRRARHFTPTLRSSLCAVHFHRSQRTDLCLWRYSKNKTRVLSEIALFIFTSFHCSIIPILMVKRNVFNVRSNFIFR